MSLDVARIRKDFPILDRTVRGGPPPIPAHHPGA